MSFLQDIVKPLQKKEYWIGFLAGLISYHYNKRTWEGLSPGMFGVGAITRRQRKELDEIEAQLRKASKMHASQADRISQISGPVNVF